MFAASQNGGTGRELAARSNVSTAQAARDLRELEDVGIVEREVHGRSYVWTLNREHVLARPLRTLFWTEASLRDELVREIANELGPAQVDSVRLFGSIARGDERADSDVDLYVQIRSQKDRERVEDSLERIRQRVWARFGNRVAAVIYTAAEARHPKNPQLMTSIQRDGLDIGYQGAKARRKGS